MHNILRVSWKWKVSQDLFRKVGLGEEKMFFFWYPKNKNSGIILWRKFPKLATSHVAFTPYPCISHDNECVLSVGYKMWSFFCIYKSPLGVVVINGDHECEHWRIFQKSFRKWWTADSLLYYLECFTRMLTLSQIASLFLSPIWAYPWKCWGARWHYWAPPVNLHACL